MGFGWNRYNQNRDIAFLGQNASSAYNGQHYLAKATIGYDIPVSPVTITPLASLQMVRAITEGYSETGAGAANLSVDSNAFNSVQGSLGAKLSWSYATPWGQLVPEIRAAWLHDFTTAPIATSGAMGGVAFTSTSARNAADGAKLAVGAMLEQDGDLSIRLDYEAELRRNYQSHTGLLKARMEF